MVCICTSVSSYFDEINEIAFPELEQKFSNDFALFITSNDIRIFDIVQAPKSYLDQSFPDFVFVYLHSCSKLVMVCAVCRFLFF